MYHILDISYRFLSFGSHKMDTLSMQSQDQLHIMLTFDFFREELSKAPLVAQLRAHYYHHTV